MLQSIKRFYVMMHIVYPLSLAIDLVTLYIELTRVNNKIDINLWISLLLLLVFVCYVIAMIVFVVFQVMWTYKLGNQVNVKEKANLTMWHGTWAWFIPILSYYLPLRFIKDTNDSLISKLAKKEATTFGELNHKFAVWFYVSIASNAVELIYNKIAEQNTIARIDINLISIVLTSIMYYYGISVLNKQKKLVTLYLKKSK
jgi:hypothetical protein